MPKDVSVAELIEEAEQELNKASVARTDPHVLKSLRNIIEVLYILEEDLDEEE